MADSLPPDRVTAAPAVGIAGVILAAGAGERLRPLTFVRPKALCPVGNVALVDSAIERVRAAVGDVAVNVHHGRVQLEPHLRTRGDLHVSVEEARALGAAGAIGFLREWLDGRGALIVNADAWCPADLVPFVAGWDRERTRLLLHRTTAFGPGVGLVASLLPATEVARCEAVPSGLYERLWKARFAEGALDVVSTDDAFVDCGTPAQYLLANLFAVERAGASIVAGDADLDGLPAVAVDRSCVGSHAQVRGRLRETVVWDGAEVFAGERLDRAIRVSREMTVVVR